MVDFGPWVEYGPIGFSTFTGYPETGVPTRYRSSNRARCTASMIPGINRQWRISQSTAAFTAGQLPEDDLDARLCAQSHARQLDGGFMSSWDPGECTTVIPETVSTSGAGSVVSMTPLAQPNGARARPGTITNWTIGLPFTSHHYTCQVTHSRVSAGYVSPFGEADLYRSVPTEILVQTPGWLAAVADLDQGSTYTADDPVQEVVRVDAVFTLACPDPQTDVTHVHTVNACALPGGDPGTMTPYNSLGAVDFSVPTVQGATGTLAIDDVHASPGAPFSRTWDLASSRVMANADPGAMESNRASVQWNVDFFFTYRVRLPLVETEIPLRWRQRDDGLGVGGARRHKGGTSVQVSKRHNAYR